MIQCKFFNRGYCKFGNQCKFIHQQQNYRYVISKPRINNLNPIKEISNEVNNFVIDELVIVKEVNDKLTTNFFNIFVLPNELLEIILNEVYLSDMVLVCKEINKKVCDFFPRAIFSIINYTYEKARNIEDAIYQIAVKTIWSEIPMFCGSISCFGQCDYCKSNKSILDRKSNITEYEKQYPQFALFRKKLLKDLVYQRQIEKQFEIERKRQKLFIGKGILCRYQDYMNIKIYNTYFKLQNKTFEKL